MSNVFAMLWKRPSMRSEEHNDAVRDVEFSDWKGVSLYQENHKANANYIYLEMEQALFE